MWEERGREEEEEESGGGGGEEEGDWWGVGRQDKTKGQDDTFFIIKVFRFTWILFTRFLPSHEKS